MSIVIFILVLVALIVVHELGHFVAAKLFRMRVEEFGLGYPPRALTLGKRNGTEYTLNWLPFGGFVRIHGEDSDAVPTPDSFSAKPRWQQAAVLCAGILMNFIFAWVLLSGALALGMPRGLTAEEIPKAPDASLAISEVLSGSPAAVAGLRPGDVIRSATAGNDTFRGADADAFTSFVARSAGKPVALSLSRDGSVVELSATPTVGAVAAAPGRAALGVGVAPYGTVPVPLFEAPVVGARITFGATQEIATGLVHFFAGLLTFSADLSQVSGPVGIANAIGAASVSGLVALMTLTAVISINLGLINVIPVPALDGGRLLFVLIEAVLRKPLPSGLSNAVNTVGFGLLILLMLVVTAHDVFKLFL